MDDKVTQLRQILRSSAANEDERLELIAALQKDAMYSDFDESYLHALLFPEYSPAVRIPTPFGIPSTLVTQRFSFYINTGQGDGFVSFLPQDLSYTPCFRSMSGNPFQGGVASADYPRWNGLASNLHCVIPVPEGDISNLQNAFTAMRLVGASMRIAYTGTVDQEKGFIVASHVYDKRVVELSEKAIEEGYYVTRTRPSEGVRLVYQPKDDIDFTYQELNRKWGPGAAASNVTEQFFNDQNQAYNVTVSAYMPSDILLGGRADRDQLDETPSYREYVWKLQQNLAIGSEYSAVTTNILNWQQLNAGSEAIRIPLEQQWGMGPRMSQGGACPQQLVCYYKGLPENQECLRIDIVRHFEAVPRTALKDLVAVARPCGSEDTMKIATKIGPQVPACQSSTLAVADTVREHASDVISNSSKAKDILKGLGKRLNPGSWKGPLGEMGRQAIVGASGLLLGPEAVPFAEAGMQALKKTTGGQGGAGGVVNTYHGRPNGIGADLLKVFKSL